MVGLWVVLMMIMSKGSSIMSEMSCGDAISGIHPCNNYLAGIVPKLSEDCCLAVKKINEEATTLQNRRDMCACLNKVAPMFGYKPHIVDQLPSLCHLQVRVPIGPTIDCAKITV
ncbi:hypothetical protein M5689_018478 [Euphorbia peplus]|nr:hypothetical protein M5689_018478 [Euphorbia peplus]